MSDAVDEKQMRLRYAGVCRACGADLPARTEAVYERSTRSVRCLDCSPSAPAHDPVEAPTPISPGVPGASARREHERRRGKREARIRERHPRLGSLILAVTDDPQSTTAWQTGAIGEERLGRGLDELSSPILRVLHDRRIPGTRANIDHLAVTPTGIYVIDAKRYQGQRPTLKVEGGIVRPRVEKLLVGTRDRTGLVDGLLQQVDVVRAVVGDDVPVTGVLCFIESDWPLIGGNFVIRSVQVLWPRKLHPRLRADGPLAPDVDRLHRQLATALAPA